VDVGGPGPAPPPRAVGCSGQWHVHQPEHVREHAGRAAHAQRPGAGSAASYARPAAVEPAISGEMRRPVILEFPDVFHLLLDRSDEEYEEIAPDARPAERLDEDFF